MKPTATQFDRTTQSTRAIDLVIGLDFGTAITKVVVRSPFEFDNRAFGVPFNSFGPAEKYLLASQVTLSKEGEVTLCSEEQAARGTGSLKWRLLSEQPEDAEAEAVAFLACVLRHTRTWFLASMAKGYGGARLRWSLQLGMPAASDENTELRARYERVGQAAWLLSVTSGSITLARARESVVCLADDVTPTEPLADFFVVPEVAAEVAGYARSDLRRTGLHFLVDVGAATLDVAGFILHENDEGDLYPILEASVTRRGTTALQRARCETLTSVATRPLLKPPASFLGWAGRDEEIIDAISAADEEFRAAARRQLGEIIREVRRRRDPNAKAWTEGVPLFLCGGGRGTSVYKSAVARLNRDLAKAVPGWPGFIELKMGPGYERLVAPGLPKKQYHRMAVAWGLSIPFDDIGKVVRPGEIEDIEATRDRAQLPDYVGPEMV